MSKITNDRLNPVWRRMLYSCTHITTVGVKGLTEYNDGGIVAIPLYIPFLEVPFRRTSIGKRSFSCAAPATWNSLLLLSLIMSLSLLSIKSRLKTHLFNIAYRGLATVATCSASTSGATALWRSTNALLLLLLLCCWLV